MSDKETGALNNSFWWKAVVEEATIRVSRAAAATGKGRVWCLVAYVCGDSGGPSCVIQLLVVAAKMSLQDQFHGMVVAMV